MSDINLISVPLLDWPYVVTSITNTPPGSPSLNDCYVVGTSPTGAWSGHASGIARWNSSSAWEFQTPSAGRTVYVTGLSAFRMWNGSTWVELPTKVPTGGSSGQVLAKNSSTDYDASWAATHYVPTGGSTGQALTKSSGSDYDAAWTTIGYASGPLTVYFFASTLSISNATGAIGDLAVVGGSPQGLYYKDASNTWTLGGSITSTTTYGSVTGLTVGGSNTNGVASSAARSDHVHSLPAFGTTSGTFAQGNDSRLSDDRTASGIRTATTVVSVSSATAPTSGQVLTATGGSAATWQTPASGAPSGSAGGDLGGTYPNPTVTQARGLLTASTTVSVSSATAPTAGQVLTATSSTAATWQTPPGSSSTTTVKKAGTSIGTRGAINLVEGSNVTITATDDSANDRVNITIASSGATSFDPTVDINPRHYWRASGTVQSGGLVDTITDIGRIGGKNFTQTGAARCPTATDGSGRTYLAPDGTTDYYQAGTTSDWAFLHNNSVHTICMVFHRPAAITTSEVLLDTAGTSRVNIGMSLNLVFTSSTVQGPGWTMYMGTGTTCAQYIEYQRPQTSITTLIIKYVGDDGAVVNPGVASKPFDAAMRVAGSLVGFSNNAGGGSISTSSTSFKPLTLFARDSGSSVGVFTSARLYELWIDDRAVPDRLISAYESWAYTNYAAVC